jgi:hypothetical protein
MATLLGSPFRLSAFPPFRLSAFPPFRPDITVEEVQFSRVGPEKTSNQPEEAMTMDQRDGGSTDINEVLNPHRGEEQRRAREHAADVLARRGILLFGDESDDELAELWSAVDRFEAMVEARGGDTMTNTPNSPEPENPAFVLPERRARESASSYTRRILEAAARLTRVE